MHCIVHVWGCGWYVLVCMDQHVWNQAGRSPHPAGTDVLLNKIHHTDNFPVCVLWWAEMCSYLWVLLFGLKSLFDVRVSDKILISSTFPRSFAVDGSCERLPGLTSQTVLRLLFSFLRHQGRLCLSNCIYRSYRSVLPDPYFLKKCLHTLTESLSVRFMDLRTPGWQSIYLLCSDWKMLK